MEERSRDSRHFSFFSSARMTAKQCLRHDWLRGAPTQASPHLRRYLSKSREVLLERVVSRENLRRAALMSQTTSHANLCADIHDQNRQRQGLQDCLLSQSEMCLNHCLTESRSSLAGSEGYPSPADSQASLNSSRTSLSCASQSCLLNQEQTRGLLSKAQSRSHANLNQGASRGILSKIRSLNCVQSQACLLNGSSAMSSGRIVTSMNPVISKSREKLYGLRSLSKSQGVLDIYRSLECLRRRRKSYQRARTEDMLPIFKQLDAEIASSRLTLSISGDRMAVDTKLETGSTFDKLEQDVNHSEPVIVLTDTETSYDSNINKRENSRIESNSPKDKETKSVDLSQTPRKLVSESEENLDSLKSVESDTLTEDSDEMPPSREVEAGPDKRPCERQHSDASSRSNNSGASDDKEDRSTESENEEPKYTVAQLVSAFNKHQEVASKTSLEAIMSEKRINEVTFPTGTKALRLFIPDINITESKIVRRKTSYKPRKNWEELRKRNEKNEGVLKSFDSGNEDDDDDEDEARKKAQNDFSVAQTNEWDSAHKENDTNVSQRSIGQKEDANLSLDQWPLLQSVESNGQFIFVDNTSAHNNLDTTIDEKYKQCVKGAMSGKMETPEDKIQKPLEVQGRIDVSILQKERLPNYIYPDITSVTKDDEVPKKTTVNVTNGRLGYRTSKDGRIKSNSGADTANVNLKDILQRVDSSKSTPRENLENLRKRTSIAKVILNDNLVNENQYSSDTCRTSSRAKSEPPSTDNQSEEGIKLEVPPSIIRSSSLSSDSSCPTPSSVQSDTNMSWEDVQVVANSNTRLEKEDGCRTMKKNDIQRTSSEGKTKQCVDDRRVWGRICTGSYNRAMERFSNKNIASSALVQQVEKTRRKSSPVMPQYVNR